MSFIEEVDPRRTHPEYLPPDVRLRLYNAALKALPREGGPGLWDLVAAAYMNRGDAYFKLGRLEEALRDYDKAYEILSHVSSLRPPEKVRTPRPR